MDINWKDISRRVYEWILEFGPGILLSIIVFFLGLFLIRVINGWIKKGVSRKGVNPSIRSFLQNLVAIVLQILLVVVCLQIAGLQLTLFSAIMAGLTVAAGLALSGTLQNFVSGILILYLKPYRVGENVSTQGQEGTVTSIQLFYTTVLTFDNRTLIIPNGQLSNSVVINLSREGKRRMDIDLWFGYETEISQVKNVLVKTLSQSTDIDPQPTYRVGVSALEEDRFVVTVNMWTSAHGFNDTRLKLNERIITDLRQASIKFPGM